MKTLNKLFATGAMAFLLMLMAPHKSIAQDDGYVSNQEFYDELQQYGTWVQDDQYGDVWVPDVDGDFRPYATNGYWVQTDYGTTWVSDYPWGWATFHYGRWRYDDYYGWEWIPGHEWAPAWVSWRQGGGYYGWAPMGPGISLTLSLGGIGLNINNNYWVYAPQRYITSRYIHRYYAPRTQINIIIRKTTYIHNAYVYNKRTYITGPRPADIQRITRRKVTVYKINDAPRPGGFHVGVNVINIYRPAIRKTPDARPVRVVSATAYKNEHPTEGIGKRGAIGYNHGNAGKLASAARTNNPDGKVVRVNPRKEEPNGTNKRNEHNTNPAIPAEGHKTNEPKANPAGNKPAEPQGNAPGQPAGARGHHKNAPVTLPAQGGQQAQPAGNKPAEPQGNTPAQPAAGRGHHKTTPPATQPEQGAVQPQPQVNKPAEPQGNPPAQPGQGGQPARHQHKQAPAVIPPAQNNTDQAKKEEQQRQQQAAQQQKQEQRQAQQAARQQAAQQQKEQQQQTQQAARQQAQQQKEQQQQAAQQQKQQQQQAQQAARQQAQQQKLQQQQAQQATRQQAQQAAQQARQQAEQQKKEQEEQQKKQQQTPPRN